jgi:2-dehydro-3-deoxyglucarate aldolase/4-hydroxy-2-oxoheptanedioate aldolase
MTLLTLPGRAASDDAPLGTWLKIPAVEPVEIMAFAGFDFVIVDLEHAPLTLETAYRLINLAALSGMSPLVRVPDHGPSTIQRVLDAGAHGVLVPHVDSVDEARVVARAVRFPPHGDRGAGGTSRAGQWGLRPTPDYLAFGNERALCVPQLESAPAVEAAADIVALDGIDAIFVGAADLALSMGAGPGDPRVPDLIAHAIECATAAGKPCGLAFGGDPAAGANAAAKGAGFVVLSNDTTLLATAARGLVRGYRG